MTATPTARPEPSHTGPADIIPPLALPGLHLAAALFWFVVGSVGLVLVAPDLAGGGFLGPHVVAVTHAFTLGWITTAIFGALYQLYPVALGVAARSIRLGFHGLILLQLGVTTVIAGAWFWTPSLLVAGWVVLASAVGVMAWNLLPGRRCARRGRQIGLFVSVGHASLGLAMGIVLVRIGAEMRWWFADRLGLLVAHVHLAAVGFATLTAVGVGSKLLPMFLLSRDYSNRSLTWLLPVACTGLAFHAIGSIWRVGPISLLGAMLIAAAIAGWLLVVSGYYRKATRERIEPGLAHAAAAFSFLGITTAVGLGLVVMDGTHPRLIAAYAVLGVLGWLSLLIVGMSYKILPFLTWLHRYSPRAGEQGLPKVTDLTKPRLQWLTLFLLVPAITALAISVALGLPSAARCFATIVGACSLLVAGQHAALLRWR